MDRDVEVRRHEDRRVRGDVAGRRPLRAMILLSSLPLGGAERSAVAVLEHLPVVDVEPVLVTLNRRRDSNLVEHARRAGIRRVDIGARRMVDPAGWLRLRRLVHELDVDVVHAHDQDALVYAVIACIGGPPVVATRHLIDEEMGSSRDRLRERLVGAAARLGDPRLLAVSGAVRTSFSRQTGVPEAKIGVLHNGVDTRVFRADRDREAVRRDLGWDRDRPVVCMIGVLREGKGHDVLFDAAAEIVDDIPDAQIAIVGDGPEEGRLRARATARSLPVEFLGSRMDVADITAASDVVVLPSWQEALPTVLIEAGACGVPVVATRVGGVEEIVVDGSTGLLTERGDAPGFARAVVELLRDDEMRRRMGEQAEKHITSGFSLSSHVENLRGVYDELVGTPHTADAADAATTQSRGTGALRVLLIEHNPSGGMYQYAWQLGAAMAGLGSSTTLLTGPDPEFSSRQHGFRVLPILPTWHVDGVRTRGVWWRRVRRVWRATKALRAWLLAYRVARRTRPDVVQFNHLPRMLDGFFAWLIMLRTPAVGAIVAHTPRPLSWRRGDGIHQAMSFWLRHTTGAAYDRADVVFVLGERSRQELAEVWPSVTRVEQIAHGSGPSLDVPAVAPADATAPRVLFFGTWARYKGIDLLLDAFARVRLRCPDAELVIAGAVTKDADADAIERTARRIGGVDLRPGYVPADEVSTLFASARVVALPYTIANYSGVADLAHAHARPVVVTDVGDLHMSVASGGGYVVPQGDAEGFAAALVRLLDDPSLAREEGRRGHERVERAWVQTAEQFLGVYRELCTGAVAQDLSPQRPR